MIPIKKLSKKQVEWLAENRCNHGHTYLQHYGCYLRENKPKRRIGMFDIESGGSLTADWGFVLTYAIKELDGELITNTITPKEVFDSKVRDKRLVIDCCHDLIKFDTIVVYYGKDAPRRHDLPFVRTRALKWGIKDFPKWKEIRVVDMYDIVKRKMKLYRRKMSDACRIMNIPADKHPWNPDVWHDAMTGNQKAIDYILMHNVEDVTSLERLYKGLVPYCGSFSTT